MDILEAEAAKAGPDAWKASIHKLYNKNPNSTTVIGRLQFFNTNKAYDFKTLLIAVVDKSGSMSGNPISQVRYSLDRVIDVAYNYPSIITNLVMYNDKTETIELNKKQPAQQYRNTVNALNADGGTSFRASFDAILQVCQKYNTNKDITSISIIYLTDGEDSSVSKADRIELVRQLKKSMLRVWSGQFTVHTVGFGQNHDYEFLNNLRQIGTTEGAFRYAEPGENTDALSSKINSLLNVISSASAIPIKLVPTDVSIPVISGEGDKYWIDLSKGYDMTQKYEFQISINNSEPIPVKAEFAEQENNDELWEKWCSTLIDDIASEILALSNSKDVTLDKLVHCELLQQRAQAIASQLNGENPEINRIESLLTAIKTLKTGGAVSQPKLNDLKFEGKFATNPTNSAVMANQVPDSKPVIQAQPVVKSIKWEIIAKESLKRCPSTKDAPEVFSVISRFSNTKTINWATENLDKFFTVFNNNDSNGIIAAASIGRYHVLKVVLDLIDKSLPTFNIDHRNKQGYNALDLAILCGYWNTYDVLREAGAKPSVDGRMLLRTCISRGYYNIATRLLKDQFVQVTGDLVDNAPHNTGFEWLSVRSSKKISVETAIEKGMYDVVAENLNEIKKISWKPYLEIFARSSPDHVRIVELLVKNDKADPCETIEITNEEDKEIAWPLFIACEKGQMNMFKLLMKLVPQEHLNKQNLKGTTCFWIACCNRHIDIVSDLLTAGADPNIANFKGDGPLIPCCQKGSNTIVEILLDFGIDVLANNKNRDNAVIICCRVGQSKILELLLKHLQKKGLMEKIFKECAQIDGFNPLLAAAEQDRVECIKVLHKFGDDLEFRTADNNEIIAGATALHLACFYGRLASVQTLCSLGSNIYSQTYTHGYSPLHIAIRQGHPAIVRYLVSLDKDKKLMKMADNEGKLPEYYAGMTGNEAILEEFFTNNLVKIMNKVVVSSPEDEVKCTEVLVKYGRSIGCYEYNEILSVSNEGMSILSLAILYGRKHLINALKEIGADFNKPDDNGITPLFWAIYLDYDTKEFAPNDATLALIDRVKAVSKKNVQNRMLLNLGVFDISLSNTELKAITALTKMNDGFPMLIQQTVLQTLKKSITEDHSILGFMEKLKSGKNFPDGKQCLEYIIWDARLHLIKKIALGDTALQPLHMMTIYLFTRHPTLYQQANLTLLNWKSNEIWQPYVQSLYQGIGQIPEIKAEVYRAVDFKFDPEVFAIGNKLKWTTFSMCSSEWKNASEMIRLKRGIVFIIKSLTGRAVGRYSKYPVDSEVIFLPDTEFRITNHYVGDVIALGQPNIRTSTFKMKENNYDKAQKGDLCVLIELEEIKEGPESLTIKST